MSETFTFPETWQWLDRPPLQLETGLQDHVVVVLYWRLGCVHSRVALYELAMAAAEFAGQAVAMVAVHVPTCDEERDEARLRRHVQTLPVPVTIAMASDPTTCERLPSMALMDVDSVIRSRAPGVPRRTSLRAAMQMLLAEAHREGRSVDAPFCPVRAPSDPSWLPTAVTSDGERLWVASARHRQVFALDADSQVEKVFGSGVAGDDDGEPEYASFSLPSSLCIHDEYVVVADSHSHTIRAIDRESGEVRTWCGTGHLGNDAMGGSYGRDQALSSPAGIVSRDGGLYLCQAGTDQVWQVDPMTGSAMAWLGGDAEDYGGDSYGAQDEGFVEPLGMADDEQNLWVVEGRGRSLSAIDLAHVQRRTVSKNFRRPVAVAVDGDRVFVADAFQATVFAVSMTDGKVEPFATAAHGLIEPVSLAMHNGQLVIADIGAAALFVCEMQAQSVVVKRLPVQGLPEPSASSRGPSAMLTERVALREYSDVTLRIETPGHDAGGEAVVDVCDEAAPLLACARREVTEVRDGAVRVLVPVEGPADGALRLRLSLGGIVTHYVLPATVSADGSLTATLVLPA